LITVPPRLNPKFLMFSGPLVGVNGLRPLGDPFRRRVFAAAANHTEPALRDDVDEQSAGAVVFGRELIAGDVDRLDLRVRRQRCALEAVDADDRFAAGHLLQPPPVHRARR
jgi:hypothetical protein